MIFLLLFNSHWIYSDKLNVGSVWRVSDLNWHGNVRSLFNFGSLFTSPRTGFIHAGWRKRAVYMKIEWSIWTHEAVFGLSRLTRQQPQKWGHLSQDQRRHSSLSFLPNIWRRCNYYLSGGAATKCPSDVWNVMLIWKLISTYSSRYESWNEFTFGPNWPLQTWKQAMRVASSFRSSF